MALRLIGLMLVPRASPLPAYHEDALMFVWATSVQPLPSLHLKPQKLAKPHLHIYKQQRLFSYPFEVLSQSKDHRTSLLIIHAHGRGRGQGVRATGLVEGWTVSYD